MFTREHEQQLAEIKAVLSGLDEGSREALERLERLGGGDRRGAGGAKGRGPKAERQAAAASAKVKEKSRPRSPDPSASGKRPGLRRRVRSKVRSAIFGPDIDLPPGAANGRPAEARLNGAAPEPLVAFVHIPKTAGGTVAAMFVSAYSARGLHKAGNYMSGPDNAVRKLDRGEADWEAWQRKGGRVSLGHVPYTVFREHVPADTRYITFLREPIDRVISHYHRHIHRRNPRLAGSPKEIAKGRVKANSLDEALTELRPVQLNNLQTRFLCDSPVQGELPPGALDDAKSNLSRFAFVGIQERFDESMEALREMLGLDGEIGYEDRHVSSDRPAVEEVPDDLRAMIAEHNQLDIELYEFAAELFSERVGAVAQ